MYEDDGSGYLYSTDGTSFYGLYDIDNWNTFPLLHSTEMSHRGGFGVSSSEETPTWGQQFEVSFVLKPTSTKLRYRFVASVWSDCDLQCNGGQQFREIRCYDFDSNPPTIQSTDENCLITQTKPDSFQTCNTQNCPIKYFHVISK